MGDGGGGAGGGCQAGSCSSEASWFPITGDQGALLIVRVGDDTAVTTTATHAGALWSGYVPGWQDDRLASATAVLRPIMC